MMAIWNRIKLIMEKADTKHIVILSMGVLGGQIVNILVQPIATRLYSPEAFGNLSLMISLGTMFAPIATLQYHIAIVHSKKEEEFALYKLNFLLVAITAFFFFFCLFGYLQFGTPKYDTVGSLIYISILWYIMNGLVSIVESYNNRHNEYQLMAKVTFNRAIVSNIVKVILGVFHFEVLGLVIAQTLGYIAGIKKQSKSIIQHWNDIWKTDGKQVLEVASRYRAQPLYALPGIFILQFSYSALAVVINTLFSTREGGFFSLSVTVLGIPLSLVSNNVSRVFLKNASEEYEKTGSFYSAFRNTSVMLISLSVVGFSLLWFIAEPAFSLVYGKEWVRSGVFVKRLIPMYAARFIVTGMMHGFVISNKQRLKTILQSLFIAAMALGYSLAASGRMEVEGFLSYINWTYFALYIVLFFVLWKQSKGEHG